MKKSIQLHPRRIFNSGANGAFLPLTIPESLLSGIGGANTVIVELTVYASSGATARLKAQVWQGTKSDIRPSAPNGGVQIGSDTIIASGLTNIIISAPFHRLVEVVVGGSSSDSGISWIEAEVNLTLSFD